MSDISYNTLLQWEKNSINPKEVKAKAKLRNVFLDMNNTVIRQVLVNDLLYYYDNVRKLRLFTFDYFVRGFLERICQTHRSPIYFKISDVEETEKKKFIDLMNKVGIHPFLAEMDLRVRLHNTVIVKVSYNKSTEEITLNYTFDPSNCEVITFDGYTNEPKIIIRPHIDNGEKKWYVWDREVMAEYVLKEEPKIVDGMITNERVYDFKEISYWPFVVYQYKPSCIDFWGSGYDSLVTFSRFMNFTYTYMNDDNIKNTMRMLMLNFIPQGTPSNPYSLIAGSDDLPDNQVTTEIKLGMDNPVYGEVFTDRDAKAELIYGDLNGSQLIEIVEKLGEQLSTMHGIGNILKDESLEEVASVAMKLKMENTLKNWKNEIQIYRQYDRNLIEKIVEVHNAEFTDSISDAVIDGLNIDYAQPTLVSDSKADHELAKMQWEDNISTKIDHIIRLNPELTEEDAKELLRRNKELNQEFGDGIESMFDQQMQSTGSVLGGVFEEGDIV